MALSRSMSNNHAHGSPQRNRDCPMTETEYALTLNSAPITIRAFPDEPLLYVLRDRLGLTGTRMGCGLNQCGACRVEIDGRLIAACDIPIEAVAGKAVMTIEGVGASQLHPVQLALEQFQAGQCGACLSGIVMTLRHLLNNGTATSEDDVRQALDANLCRCGAHPRIVAAAISLINGEERAS